MSNDFYANDIELSALDEIHNLYTAITGIDISRAGSDMVREPRPFAVYDLVFEKPYDRHQILKRYSFDLSNNETITYKNPMITQIQYTFVFDSEDDSFMPKLRDLTRYLVQDNFKLSMDRLNIGYRRVSEIKEEKVPIEGFKDRQFIFVMNYFWADIWTDSDNDTTKAGAGRIETVEFDRDQASAPEGL